MAAKAIKTEEEDDSNDPVTSDEKKRMTLAMDGGNHYEILGLGQLNISATDDQIKRAYKKLVLRYHPDKQGTPNAAAASPAAKGKGGKGGKSKAANDDSDGEESKGETDPLFLAIQKAYDVLSNEERRRGYDSQFEFDDSIPSGTEPLAVEADFFKLYTPVFDRNSRFSTKKPVPKLGTNEDSDEKVMAFYKFWFMFESWRDFSSLGEHDTSQAEFREEKRWMERQNKAAVAKAKKVEMQRVQDLVNRAYARDPRVLRQKRKEEEDKKAAWEAKQNEKKAKEDAVKKAESDRIAAEKSAEEAKKAEASAAKAIREAKKKAIKRVKMDLKRAVLDGGAAAQAFNVADADVEYICTRFAGDRQDEVLALYETVFGCPAPGLQGAAAAGSAGSGDGSGTPTTPAAAELPPANFSALSEVIATERERQARETAEMEARIRIAQGLQPAAAPATPAVAITIGKRPEVEWSPVELSMLAKAVARFPGGSRNRWVAVSNFVNTTPGQVQPRTPDDCIAKAHKVGEEDKKKVNNQAFNTAMLARRAEVEIKDTDAPTSAPAVLAPTVVVEDGKAIIKPSAAAAAAAASPVAVSDAAAAAAAAKPRSRTNSTAAPDAPANADGSDGTADSEAGVWTVDQQSALEAALKKYPATMDKNERWKSISEAVPGKTKKQCVARFKEVREKLIAAKGAGSS